MVLGLKLQVDHVLFEGEVLRAFRPVASGRVDCALRDAVCRSIVQIT